MTSLIILLTLCGNDIAGAKEHLEETSVQLEQIFRINVPRTMFDELSGGGVTVREIERNAELVEVERWLVNDHLRRTFSLTELLEIEISKLEKALASKTDEAKSMQDSVTSTLSRNTELENDVSHLAFQKSFWFYATILAVVVGGAIIALQQWRIHWTNSLADPAPAE